MSSNHAAALRFASSLSLKLIEFLFYFLILTQQIAAAASKMRGVSIGRRALASQATAKASSSAAFPSYIMNAPATEVTTLGNGLRVASEGESHYQSIYLYRH